MYVQGKTTTVCAGEMLVTIATAGKCGPQTVLAVGGLTDGAMPVSLDLEVIERLAAIARDLREQEHDYRGCCSDHGYYVGESCHQCSPLLQVVSDDADTKPGESSLTKNVRCGWEEF